MIVKCTVEFKEGTPIVIENGKITGSTESIRKYAQSIMDDIPDNQKRQYLPPIDTVVAERLAEDLAGKVTTEVVVEDSKPTSDIPRFY